MKRLHLFEFADQSWCPTFIRRAVTEYLAAATRLTKLYQPTAEVLRDLLSKTSEKTIFVLGAGSGGGILDVFPDLPADTQIVLTDLLPDNEFKSPDSRIQYRKEPVDAFNLSKGLSGIWVMYTAFHHFPPLAAKKILSSAVMTGRPIAIFEGAPRSLAGVLTTLLIPLMVLLLTPFVRPFRWTRLIFTYLIPIFPTIFFWDGVVSNLRTYSLDELKEMTADLTSYDWEIRELHGSPLGIPTLVGKPK